MIALLNTWIDPRTDQGRPRSCMINFPLADLVWARIQRSGPYL